jgi:hypothetical protein
VQPQRPLRSAPRSPPGSARFTSPGAITAMAAAVRRDSDNCSEMPPPLPSQCLSLFLPAGPALSHRPLRPPPPCFSLLFLSLARLPSLLVGRHVYRTSTACRTAKEKNAHEEAEEALGRRTVLDGTSHKAIPIKFVSEAAQ